MSDDASVLRRTAPPDLSTRNDGRTIYGIIVPFDREARVNDGWGPYTEVIRYGAFTKTIREQGDRCKLCLNHDKTNRLPVGRATSMREEKQGVYGEFRVSTTRDGDDALALVRDGVVDAFSVGMIPVKEREATPGYVERTEVKMTETSLVGFPAYESARIAGIRSAYGLDEGEWDRLRDLLRAHPGLLDELTRTLILDTPDPGAVTTDLDEVGSEPAEATRDDTPADSHASTYTPARRPARSPEEIAAARRDAIGRVRAAIG